MDTVTYPDPRVAEFVEQHLVPVKIAIRDNKDLAEQYHVSWTPNVVIADEDGHVHYRIEGYLPPEDFLARLSLGLGEYELNRQQFADAAHRFEEVAQRHPETEAEAEALYWLGVAHFKETHDPSQLKSSWSQLAKKFPDSVWTRRTQIPSKS
jgi:Thioredoxin-like domain/Tetratricopeptide repeat